MKEDKNPREGNAGADDRKHQRRINNRVDNSQQNRPNNGMTDIFHRREYSKNWFWLKGNRQKVNFIAPELMVVDTDENNDPPQNQKRDW